MPKTDAERARAYIARKRSLARAAGRCASCCKKVPKPGHVTCKSCSLRASKRSTRKRKRDHASAKFGPLIAAHERAGDVAKEHHFHGAAAQHYKDALQVRHFAHSDEIRLMEKLSEALWFGNEPTAAVPWNRHLLRLYRSRPEQAAKTINTLFVVARQLWTDSNTEARLPVLKQASRLAELTGNRALIHRANVMMANTCMLLGDHKKAENYLQRAGPIDMVDDVTSRAGSWMQKGMLQALRGDESGTFDSFDRAVEAARDGSDPYRLPTVWADYGLVAMTFGRTELAKSCRERALLAARRNNIVWLIVKYCLDYAELFTCMGQHDSAYGYLVEALSIDAKAPLLDEEIAWVGIPIALRMKDEATLLRCARSGVINRSFSSGEPERIGYTAAAFARFHTERGEFHTAQTVLHRAVKAMNNIASNVFELPTEVARTGAHGDIPLARRMLEARAALPASQVAEAGGARCGLA